MEIKFSEYKTWDINQVWNVQIEIGLKTQKRDWRRLKLPKDYCSSGLWPFVVWQVLSDSQKYR
jgi:hypothetical protein